MIGKINANGIPYPNLSNPAVVSDVISGKQIVDKNGNILTGNMVDRGNWTGSVGMNSSIIIPAGRHGGEGRVNGPTITQMAGTTITPSASVQTISCSGKYMTSNIVINKVTPPPANKMVAGYTYMGVTGTANAIDSSPADLYNRGSNPAGFTAANSALSLQSGMILFSASNPIGVASQLNSFNAYNIAGYSRLSITMGKSARSRGNFYIELYVNQIRIGSCSIPVNFTTERAYYIPFSNMGITGKLQLAFTVGDTIVASELVENNANLRAVSYTINATILRIQFE